MKLAVIGGGKMATALLKGVIASDVYPVHQIAVAESVDQLALTLSAKGFTTFTSADLLPEADTYLLAVKPQDITSAIAQLRQTTDLTSKLVISIAAGITHATLKSLTDSSRIIRSMPNLPFQVGCGCTFAYATELSKADKSTATKLFKASGSLHWLDNEELIDAATALSGSGPAYVFFFIEAVVNTGIKLGLDKATALAAAFATFKGATELASTSDQSLAQLQTMVASKGGTTEAALVVLKQKQVAEAIEAAMQRAKQRAVELAAISDK